MSGMFKTLFKRLSIHKYTLTSIVTILIERLGVDILNIPKEQTSFSISTVKTH